MVSVSVLWMPIVLSAVLIFLASSVLHMVLKFWHGVEITGFRNEDEVAAAIRNGGATAGIYMIPHCAPDKMREPAAREYPEFHLVGTPLAQHHQARHRWLDLCVAGWLSVRRSPDC
jgi:hypothetical protein